MNPTAFEIAAQVAAVLNTVAFFGVFRGAPNNWWNGLQAGCWWIVVAWIWANR